MKKKLIGKTLIAYSTKSGVNAQAADAISDVLNKNYNMDVTIHDLGNGSPDIMPFQNIIVGGGVKGKSVYGEAVDFWERILKARTLHSISAARITKTRQHKVLRKTQKKPWSRTPLSNPLTSLPSEDA